MWVETGALYVTGAILGQVLSLNLCEFEAFGYNQTFCP